MLKLLFGAIGILPNLFSSVDKVTAAISNERIKLIEANTEEERIASQERINTLQARRDVLVAESNISRVNAFIRAWIGGDVAFILTKLYVWDKGIGSLMGCSGTNLDASCKLFHTDDLSPELWQVVMATIGFYFLYEGAVNTARIIKSR